MAWIKFWGYQLGNYPMIDVCEYDANKNYILTHDGCAWVMEDIDVFLSQVDWYIETSAQTLQHDVSWNLVRA